MTNIGIVGIGFMGMIHYLAARKLKGARVSAISTRNPKKLEGDWTMIQGNFGPRGGHEDLAAIERYSNANDLLNDSQVDLVDICLPNDQHAQWVIRALQAGKDVLCEKPIALKIEDADRMIEVARETGKTLMVAHVLPYFADFLFAHKMIKTNEHGKLQAAQFRRHISSPTWLASMTDYSSAGGPVIDLHIHDTHFVFLTCGAPRQVYSRGLRREGITEYISTQYIYDSDGPVVSATSGAINQGSRIFTHGYEIYLEKATIHYEAGGPITVFGPDDSTQHQVPSSDPVDSFTEEIQAAVDAVSGGSPAEFLDANLARDSLALCLKEEESIRTGKVIDVQTIG